MEVWNEGITLFKLVYNNLNSNPKIDLKLRSQILNAAASVSANIAEGYSRKSINEYLQFLNISLGPLGEVLSRIIGLMTVNLISKDNFEEIDRFHYSVENKLLALVKSLESKRDQNTWDNQVHEPNSSYYDDEKIEWWSDGVMI